MEEEILQLTFLGLAPRQSEADLLRQNCVRILESLYGGKLIRSTQLITPNHHSTNDKKKRGKSKYFIDQNW